MNQSARKRLQAAVNRLGLQTAKIAKASRGPCCFCTCEVRPGDEYRSSGSLHAHALCVAATGAELARKEAKR